MLVTIQWHCAAAVFDPSAGICPYSSKGTFLSLCLGILEELFLPEMLKTFPEKNGWQLLKSYMQNWNKFVLLYCLAFVFPHNTSIPLADLTWGTLLTEEGIERPCKAVDQIPVYRLGWCWDIAWVWNKQMCRWQKGGKISSNFTLQLYLHRFN